MNKVPLTVVGAELLRNELQRLKSVERPNVIAAIAEARSHGDLSENAEYDAAKEKQGFIEGRIKDLEGKLANAQIIDPRHLDAEGRVVSVAESTTPYSEKSLPAAGPAQYVLEVNAGFAKEHGIGPGTRVELPADIQTRAAASDSGS